MIREFERFLRAGTRYFRERTKALRAERKARRKPPVESAPKRPETEEETEDVILGDMKRQAAAWKGLADTIVEPYKPPAGAPRRKVDPPPASKVDPPRKPWEPGDGIVNGLGAADAPDAPEAQEEPAPLDDPSTPAP